jgi:cytochrome c553
MAAAACYDRSMTYPFSRPAQTYMRAFVLFGAALAVGKASIALPVLAADAPDLALGRHLAQECSGCHAGAAAGSAIPQIVGRPAAEIAAALAQYATGFAPDGAPANMTMVSVARSLDARQTAAIAAYLATVK